MSPYDTPGTPFDRHLGPNTAVTPKIAAHGAGHNLRMEIVKGNPVGYVLSPSGAAMPYLSARQEHAHLPTERAMIAHSRMGNVDIDHYHLGQIMPAVANAPRRQVRPSSQYRWPDTSISSSLTTDIFGQGGHPGQQYGKDVPYGPDAGVVRKP